MFAREVVNGPWRIWALADEDGTCPLEEFVSGLPKSERRKVLAMLDHVAEGGTRALPSDRCHQIDDEHQIYQFTAGQVRILWFYDRDKIILCSHAFLKRTNKTPKRERERAVAARKACRAGSVTLVKEHE
ncbi:type II toxin-antitoxin system RelE/ParE family toxin [Caenispirillum bisanense]|uniref:Phage derived protein Gp49-like n=1 Tax=Caenispirillum bisanense TaxID=414052 RepID=A0A286GAM2_9PROT|nr:type II toxin-antitoxin system RelE/ParE family toxin [Caenispirillum bisanense]SOD92541.1 Phage derived protein Gp49-like [Caenispirillum bisanense]